MAAICYSSWILEFALPTRVDPVDGYVSELSAADQPWHWFFSAGDLVSGVLMVIVALLCLVSLQHRLWTLLGWVFLLAFGVSAIGDALFSMDCAPSTDTVCALRERAGRVSFSHQFHDVTSSLVITFGIAALLALAIAARRYRVWPALARWGTVLAAAEAVTSLATVVLMLLGVWLGLAQRAQISILCVGLLLIGWELGADQEVPTRASAVIWSRTLLGSGAR